MTRVSITSLYPASCHSEIRKKKTNNKPIRVIQLYYSVVMELLVPQSEAASKLMRKFSDKSDNW